MNRRPSTASASLVGRVTLSLHGPIGETGRDDRQPGRPVRGPAHPSRAVEVLVILCRHAPEVTYEELQADGQAQLGIGRARLGGVLTSLAGARKRLPRDVGYPIERDKDLRRYRIEPVGAELLLGAVERARAAGLLAGRGSADA
jgi:hypothetical protein